MSGMINEPEIVDLEFPQVYIRYHLGEKFFKKEDAIFFMSQAESPKVSVKPNNSTLECVKVYIEHAGERIEVFRTPPSKDPVKDLEEIRLVMGRRYVQV